MDFPKTKKMLKRFAKAIIRAGRIRLAAAGMGRSRLIKNFSYQIGTITEGDLPKAVSFTFGGSKKYWQFVDEGVRGSGGFKGSGRARGGGSAFRFKYANPSGAMVKAIKGWIKNKPVSLGDMNITGLAFAIGYSIKRRGLERTMFYSNPVNKALKTLPDELTDAFRLDVEKLVGKLPSKIKAVDKNLQT